MIVSVEQYTTFHRINHIVGELQYSRGVGRHLGLGGHRGLTGLICMAKIQFL